MTAHEDNGQERELPAASRRSERGWLARWFGGNSKESPTTRSYRRLAMQLERDLGRPDKRGHSLLLTAPDSARIMSEASLELAHFLAEELRHRVLLVDASLGSAGLDRVFGHDSAIGMLDLLRDGIDRLDSAVRPTEHKRIFILGTGQPESGGQPSSTPDELRALLDAVCAKFDYVLLHGNPILEDSKCLMFASLVDRVLLLAVEGRTLLDDLDVSRQALADCGAERVGIVLTKAPRRWFLPR